MENVETLRTELLEAAGAARVFHIDKKMDEYQQALAEVKRLLDELRDFCRQDRSLLNEKLLADIRVAKICARILTAAELKQEAIKKAHAEFLTKLGIVNLGTRISTKKQRIAHCYSCKVTLDSSVDLECERCGWILCACGACGCGYSRDGRTGR